MHINLEGLVAVVTGAGRGIGHDVALRLAQEGVTTVILDINADDLTSTSAELAATGSPTNAFVCDVTDADAIEKTVAAIVEQFGRIDVLVNNAGVIGPGTIEVISEKTWRRCFDINVTGTFLMCKAVVPVMKKQHSGRIINASSFAAIVPSVGHSAYAAAKAAVAHFSRALAGELGPWDITVNAYAPGMIPTEMNHFAELPEAEQDTLKDTLTLRRWGKTDDIGNLICFLASEQAGYITGTLVDVSGGKLATQIPSVAYDLARADTA